ncbi:MAG TPA: hypothetical protein VMM58_08635, partial [Bacteroidota bacterium]|nr:hypothetical protein [Bacteroidota bacterium]
MKFTILFFLMAAAFYPAKAQIIEHPLFPFERLSWGMKFSDAQSDLKGRALKPLEPHEHSFIHEGGDNFGCYYLDSMYQARVLV